jgi:hypothetical protein
MGFTSMLMEQNTKGLGTMICKMATGLKLGLMAQDTKVNI